MNITDEKARQILKKIDSSILMETIDGYPEDERDGRSDLEFVADEISYQISCFNEDGHDWKDELEEARTRLRKTKNGKIIPLDPQSLKPIYGYYPYQLEGAKALVAEYKRLVNALKKLQKADIYGFWYTI